jgi:hypothetical protein
MSESGFFDFRSLSWNHVTSTIRRIHGVVYE